MAEQSCTQVVFPFTSEKHWHHSRIISMFVLSFLIGYHKPGLVYDCRMYTTPMFNFEVRTFELFFCQVPKHFPWKSSMWLFMWQLDMVIVLPPGPRHLWFLDTSWHFPSIFSFSGLRQRWVVDVKVGGLCMCVCVCRVG